MNKTDKTVDILAEYLFRWEKESRSRKTTYGIRQAQENGVEDVTRVYSGKELGAKGSRVPPKVPEGMQPLQSQYTQQTRAGNIAMQLKKDPNTELTAKARQTFDGFIICYKKLNRTVDVFACVSN